MKPTRSLLAQLRELALPATPHPAAPEETFIEGLSDADLRVLIAELFIYNQAVRRLRARLTGDGWYRTRRAPPAHAAATARYEKLSDAELRREIDAAIAQEMDAVRADAAAWQARVAATHAAYVAQAQERDRRCGYPPQDYGTYEPTEAVSPEVYLTWHWLWDPSALWSGEPI